MRGWRQIAAVWVVACAGSAGAQFVGAPVLTSPPQVQYPPIARAAHVEGEVVVRFSIDSAGNTVSVETVSGPMMLRGAVEGQIKQWQFKTPLPAGAQENFEARYKFSLHGDEDDPGDDLDGPLYTPCCGYEIVPPNSAQVAGDVRSVDGMQRIDVTPAAPVSRDRCPDDQENKAPAKTDASDYVELYRISCSQECRNYRVRVFRDGHVEWHGRDGVTVTGERTARIRPEAAEALLTSFQGERFWSVCSGKRPADDQDLNADDFSGRGDYLTVGMDGHTKTVYVNGADDVKLAWAVDKVADTHQWRHGDSASEPYANMREDLQFPKRGMTALMRATFRFDSKGQITDEPLKAFLAAGADVDAVDESGWTALMYAAELRGFEDGVIGLLLQAHADVNRASLHGDTALMMAAYGGYLKQPLLEKGANINARNADGVTTLMLLAQRSEGFDVLKEALDAGADATAQDNEGRTALDYLKAASCEKAILPLPKPEVELVPEKPPPCPGTSEGFLKSQSLLKSAIAKARPH